MEFTILNKQKLQKLIILDNITFFDSFKPRLKLLANEVVWHKSSSRSIEETFEKMVTADSCITCWTPLPDQLLLRCTSLECVFIYSHSFSHLIDKPFALTQGIEVSYIPDYATNAVSEYVFAGILTIARNIISWSKSASRGKYLYEYIKTGSKYINSASQIEEWTLSEKKMGIIGLGEIGSSVAKKAKYGFDMDVSYYSRSRKREMEELGIKFQDIETIMSSSDIISVHVSSDVQQNFINKHLINLIKPGGLFVNTSVGHAIDEMALIERLREGDIYAFLDVFSGLPPRTIMKDLPNVLFTYRGGWFTKESIERKSRALISNIENYLFNKTPSKIEQI